MTDDDTPSTQSTTSTPTDAVPTDILNAAHASPINLFDFSRPQLRDQMVVWGEKAFRADQLFQWIHQRGIFDFDLMSDLSKPFRERLKNEAVITLPEVTFSQQSKDGTCKWLLKMFDGNIIETVFIPEEGRGTLCVSSQVGCALNCSFCATARQGFNRNLSTAEIIAQVSVAVQALAKRGSNERVTNVVMMGMGEPLLNFDNVVSAMDIMMDDLAYGLSKYRVTLSTSGVVPAMEALKQVSDCALAVSLHAPNDELRNELVPLNKKYPIEVLMKTCKNYFGQNAKRQITFEYVMLEGVNDSEKHARELVKVLQGVPAKVNLIPFNTFEYCQYKRSNSATIQRFRDILQKSGLQTNTRKTRGDDIDAACGQLVGKVQDRTSRSRLMQTADKQFHEQSQSGLEERF